jgi:hypothetical protein
MSVVVGKLKTIAPISAIDGPRITEISATIFAEPPRSYPNPGQQEEGRTPVRPSSRSCS